MSACTNTKYKNKLRWNHAHVNISTDNKDSQNLITSYLEKSKNRNSSILSPVEQEHQSKKANTGETKVDSTPEMQPKQNETNVDNLQNLLIPLMEKVDQLREAVYNKYSKLEETITTQK